MLVAAGGGLAALADLLNEAHRRFPAGEPAHRECARLVEAARARLD